MKTRIALAALIVAAAAVAIPIARASAEPSVWDGIYTGAQADRGQALYAKRCASCHRDDLKRHGQTPSLSGSAFLEKWDGQTVGDLFEKMQTSMPGDHPGTLSRQQNGEILAFILRFNEFPAGQTELRTEAEVLAKIRFQAARAK